MNSKYILNIATCAALLASGTAFAAGDTYRSGKSIYGQPAGETVGAKLIDAGQVARLNVRCGDVVTFVNGDKKFSWKFEAANHGVVDLAKIAPAGFGGTLGKVYVERNLFERS